MKNASLFLRLFSLVFLIFSSGLKAAEAKPEYGAPVGTIIVPEGLKSSEVQRAILEAGAGRGWTIKNKDDEKVVLFLEKSRWVSLLTLAYDKKEIQIYSKSTRSGKERVPEDWVKYLKQDISIKLNTLSISK